MLSPHENAAARHASYALLAQLLREPISAEIHPYLTEIPDLTLTDLSENAVQFQQLFGFAVFANESIFRDSSGLVGGEIADRVIQQYQNCGFRWQGEADHISTELQLLAFLAAAEADAFADDLPLVAARMRQLQRDFLQCHLLQWLAPLIVAIQRHGDDFYSRVADLLWQLTVDHAEQLNISVTASSQSTALSLTDPETALKTIGRFLTSPDESGWWLSAEEMGEIGRNLDLPRGFGGRIQTMMNLFRSATQYDGASALLTALQAEAEAWQRAYDELGSFTVSWQTKLATTVALLREMQVEVA